LGEGKAIRGASLANRGAPFPLVVISHGAYGSAPNYSWIAEYLARNGMVVLGVSHYGESWLYGAETVNPIAVTRLWLRPGDCTFAISELLMMEEFQERIDMSRIGALGHSSGGATALALGGAIPDPIALSEYCHSDSGKLDLGCQYARQFVASASDLAQATLPCKDSRIRAIVALDPAAGPAHSDATLRDVHIPVLIVGSADNDFLPFANHAARYASRLPNASLIALNEGEGHFVYLNACTSKLTANGVFICVDRAGVDRSTVHARLAPQILEFLQNNLQTVNIGRSRNSQTIGRIGE
jgi:predicted dienelactone hydrolase